MLLILFDRDAIFAILSKADWQFIPAALVFVAGSYLAISCVYVLLTRLMGIRMDGIKVAVICFVTTVMNRVVRSGGLSGFSLRYMMMKPFGVKLNDVLNSSFIHFLLGSLLMLGLLPIVLIYIMIFIPVPADTLPLLIVLAVMGVMLEIGIGLILFSEPLREKIIHMIVWLVRKLARKDISAQAGEYSRHAAAAVTVLKKSPPTFTIVMLLTMGELMFNVIVLGYCMKAFHLDLPFGNIFTLYIIGTLVGFISILPAGMGIQEGTITVLCMSQGISFEQSMLASILFRVLQTIIPFLVSIVFYPQFLKSGVVEAESTNAIIPT